MLTEETMNKDQAAVNADPAMSEEGKEEQLRVGTNNSSDSKDSRPSMLDTIWEAEDLGIQGAFMYYYPEQDK